MSTPVLPGDVFKLVCDFPEISKPKFLILLKTKPYEFFIINSEINNYISNLPELYACQVDVPYEDHKSFLTHDSIADCSDRVDTAAVIHEKQVTFNDLANHRVGRLASYVIEEIIHVIEESNLTLTGKEKKVIISALRSSIE
ncbi:hypothetical protein OA5_12610 [Vibrio cyclitrophicus 1F111]|uniref:hypothetical protein n=1 Tax=Vibrio cyclitrophicus TaxID=47951 RepID=UPI00036E4810|nr:hypothetical protein [Vibrio cyclitrophicus]OEF80046.1 hypothetical protein OA5_12610 [Vibrio cyclitrophicus 1F111]